MHGDANSGKLKITLIIFWGVGIRNGHGTLIFEGMNE